MNIHRLRKRVQQSTYRTHLLRAAARPRPRVYFIEIWARDMARDGSRPQEQEGHSAVKQNKIDSLKNTHLWVVVARARARAPPAELFCCLREQGRVGGEQHEYVARRPPGVRAQRPDRAAQRYEESRPVAFLITQQPHKRLSCVNNVVY